MSLDVAPDERTVRKHLRAALTHRVEDRPDERRAEALALEPVVDLGVRERVVGSLRVVTGEPGQLAVHPDLEALVRLVVAHDPLAHGSILTHLRPAATPGTDRSAA